MEHWSDTKQLQKVTSPENSAKPDELMDDDGQPNGATSTFEDEPVMDDADPGDVAALPPHHPPLQAFPKEFNKSYLEALDRRYMAILIVTLILEPLLIWYLLRTHPIELGEQEISKLQNKYAELFLSEFKVENEKPAETPTDILSHATEAIPKILESVAGGLPGGSAESGANLNFPSLRGNRGNASPETRGLSGENRAAVRRLNTITRQRGMQALAEQVERIGLLGVITSGSNGILSREQVTDILQYADSTMNDIDNAIAQVQELRVPRAGVDYYGTSVGGSARGGFAGGINDPEAVHIAQKEVRGSRATSSGVMSEDIVTGLAAAAQKNIARNQEFEHVASTPSLLPSTNAAASGAGVLAGLAGLRARTMKGPATRDRDQIREIVLSHSPAIQDCYRRQLKGNAALKGKVTVRFTINSMGYVVSAEIVNVEMTADGVPVQLPQMEECILTKIRKWRDFGQVDESQGEVTFRQTYNFGY